MKNKQQGRNQLVKQLVTELKKLNPELYFSYDAKNKEIYATTKCVWLIKFPEDWEIVWGQNRGEFYRNGYVLIRKEECSIYVLAF